MDSILDTEEIVVKPLGKELKHLATYAWAPIMGDGCVALILDVIRIARRAKVSDDSSNSGSNGQRGDQPGGKRESQPIPLIGAGAGRQTARCSGHGCGARESD